MRRFTWALFALGAAAVLAALAWISTLVLALERAEETARAEARHQEALRLAAGRMAAFLDRLLLPEQMRPTYEYQPYYSQQTAYTRLFCEIEPGEVVTPSPLLAFRSEFVLLHFQWAEGMPPSSPQVPEGNARDLAEATVLDPATRAERAERLARLAARVDFATLARAVPAADPHPAPDRSVVQQELRKRAWTEKKAQEAGLALATAEPLRPALLPSGDLVWVRRVRLGSDTALQGFLADAEWLAASLRETVSDLFPSARLLAAPEGWEGRDFPFRLEPGAPARAARRGLTPQRMGLGILWATALCALAINGEALRRGLRYGRDRQRFASTVTHELRTPLTTFQLYAEMLARGMVTDEAKRRAYLETLVEKSHALSAMVENVLAYARLEEGRRGGGGERVALGALVERCRPALEARAAAAGMRLDVDVAGDVALETNADAVGQILFNLVDNACKYAQGAADPRVHLSARALGGRVAIEVRDHGPGVPAHARRSVFEPFHRGGRDAADPVPGLGLGLALSRGLARDLGGALELAPADGGAAFVLTLPAQPP